MAAAAVSGDAFPGVRWEVGGVRCKGGAEPGGFASLFVLEIAGFGRGFVFCKGRFSGCRCASFSRGGRRRSRTRMG